MSGTASPTLADGGGPLEAHLGRAVWKVRAERLRLAFGTLVRVLLAVAIAWAVAIQWRPEWALALPMGLWIGAVVLFLTLDIALFWQIDRAAILRRLDRQLGLADGVVSAQELATDTNTEAPWRDRQLSQTLEALRHSSWSTLWPRRWPRLTGLASMGLILFTALLWMEYRGAQALAAPAMTPLLQQQLAGLEEVFRDWEEVQKQVEDAELQRLLQELKPLREKMASGEAKEREVMVALSRVEEKLEAARKSLAERSLEPSAGEMAAAFEPLEGMSALAAALRRKDFDAAEKLAANQAEALTQPEAKMPEGAKDAANQQRMEKAAQTLGQRKQGAAEEAMKKMAEGMKQGSSQKLGDGMKGMQQSLGKQAKSDADKKRLSAQLAQMGQCKECMGNGQCMLRGMSLLPKLAQQKSTGGKGAGSAIDLQRLGAQTAISANRTEEKITGEAGEGDTETTTEKSDQRSKEIASGARTARFQPYEQMSREAIDDENIPVAHRQTIRKYFEMIRPTEK